MARQLAREKGDEDCRDVGSMLVLIGINNRLLRRHWWPSEMTQDDATIALGALYKDSENADLCFVQLARLRVEDRRRRIRALFNHIWVG